MRRTLCLLLLAISPTFADVKVADMFSDFGVLQRGIKIPVWGTANPGEKVSVTFESKTTTTTAKSDGTWRMEIGPFNPLRARPLVVTGKSNTITLPRMYVGDVWVCSGQSNMQWPLKQTDGAVREIAEIKDQEVFLYTVRRSVAAEPLTNAKGTWQRLSQRNAAGFSAVAYYFGKALREANGVPVGLIHSSWGGTPAESWTSRATLEGHKDLQPIVRRWDRMVAEHPARLAAWKAADPKKRSRRPPNGPNHPNRASGLFNAMIAPVIPYGIKGVIWYQGESNAGQAEQYQTLFPAMIRDWRAAWGQGNFQFLFVQLANFGPMRTEPAGSNWAELREAQTMALAEPNTAMAVTIDIGNPSNIHPRNKREVGRRLALHALGAEVASGPLFENSTVSGREMTLRFRNAKGLRTRNDSPLLGFAIAGKDKRFFWAYARIKNDTVVVSHPLVKEPTAVRYAWANSPMCNLMNGEGLPASPFRTDDWPGVTAGRR